MEINQQERETFIPIVQSQNTNLSNRTLSKFGRKLFISNKFPWPICECKTPMQFFLQLNSNQNPNEKESIFGDGYCNYFIAQKMMAFVPKVQINICPFRKVIVLD